jgi:hypothetical protein
MNIITRSFFCPGALLAALFLLPFQLGATEEKATLLLSLTAYDNVTGGLVDGVADGHQSNAVSFSVGLLADASYHRLERGVLVFGLPPIPKGQQLKTASLRIYVRASATRGGVSVYHSQTQNRQTGTNDFYDDGSYADLVGVAATPAVGGTNDKPVSVTLDVTKGVKADYHSDSQTIISSFRLQVDDLGFTASAGINRYSFFGKAAANPDYVPVLALEFGPRMP